VRLDIEGVKYASLVSHAGHPKKLFLNHFDLWYRKANVHIRFEGYAYFIAIRALHGGFVKSMH
jgi:hypothetical protein